MANAVAVTARLLEEEGERIAAFFDTSRINIVNNAIGGRSSRTFFTEGRWAAVLAQLKSGDTLLIQFGHNDGARIGDPAGKNRGSVPGIGPETVEDTRPDGSKEQVHSFGWYLARYIQDAQAKGARNQVAGEGARGDRARWSDGEGNRDRRADPSRSCRRSAPRRRRRGR